MSVRDDSTAPRALEGFQPGLYNITLGNYTYVLLQIELVLDTYSCPIFNL